MPPPPPSSGIVTVMDTYQHVLHDRKTGNTLVLSLLPCLVIVGVQERYGQSTTTAIHDNAPRLPPLPQSTLPVNRVKH